MSNNKQSIVEDLAYWKNNAKENYITTPISVLKYITELEQHIEIIKTQLLSDEEIDKLAYYDFKEKIEKYNSQSNNE